MFDARQALLLQMKNLKIEITLKISLLEKLNDDLRRVTILENREEETRVDADKDHSYFKSFIISTHNKTDNWQLVNLPTGQQKQPNA